VPYPDRLLAGDEEVVLHLHPHWKKLVRPVLVFLATVGAGSFAAGYVEEPTVRLLIAVLGLGAVLTFSAWPVLRWANTHFILTTHRVLIRTGVLSRLGRDIPLGRVNDVSFEHGLTERVLGCGTLTVESAGERGLVVLTDVPRVEHVQGTLYGLIEEDGLRRARAVRGGYGHEDDLRDDDVEYDGEFGHDGDGEPGYDDAPDEEPRRRFGRRHRSRH
jgi:membrane protein YdbS with pleckstrin-like domain